MKVEGGYTSGKQSFPEVPIPAHLTRSKMFVEQQLKQARAV